MVTGKNYKHINNTEVAFVPTSITSTDDAITAYGYWFNIVNLYNQFALGTDTITIKRKDLKNWKEFYFT